ncbi:AAA family ATPase [Saccharopolyspora phatthalungensis]|uniref:Putative ATPase n=1 Tax=Saccharopolyspora phatthalungensis TaxID=664693 RepID=A0A840QHX2_9PSEU|nr:AAA family ATPase [Saccharopolyspora phatthalungensis]MBB5158269.1 putative ATPase [Saccharopolyspora phatthalungensis]
MSSPECFVVITGGPGAGKTALVDRLAATGLARSPEAGRGVITDQLAIGGRALPWADRVLFAELMLSWDLRSYHQARRQSSPVIFDRALPDIVGYLRLNDLPVPEHVHTAAQRFRYRNRVLLAPFWPEIYRQDGERKQSLYEAERTYEHMAAAYTDYGYELVHLPRTTVEQRARFVLDELT